MELWQSDDCVKKFEINSKNYCSGQEVAAGTHTSGSITAGEHRKKLAEGAMQAAAMIAICAGGAKKKRLFGLGSEASSYFGKKICTCNASTSSVPPSVSIPTTNMEEFVKQLIPALTTHFLPIVIERVGGIRVQEGAVLDPPPTNDDDDDVDS
ncbi:uncharacterized protein LOC124888933 [Capsicum annuum]|uniref:uncharacterized protein LOC124888933 n=1 Tax=Capsicum annuum TaxID=4072 RepID=UPI001FB0AADE|nr:uncharacterized protein LOC124888933 [Capsicum annuum]